jgi:hypothetical protein
LLEESGHVAFLRDVGRDCAAARARFEDRQRLLEP